MLYFIVNTSAGTGRGGEVWKIAKRCLQESVIAYKAYNTKYEGHATKIATKLCELPVDKVAIVVIGGDGTINEVLNGITDFQKVQLGVIPAGSGNDFAKGLHIKKDIAVNITQIDLHHRTGNVQDIDLGMVLYDGCERPRVFGISSGIGLDAIVCKRALKSKVKTVLNQIHLGKLTYIFITVHSLFSMSTVDLYMELERKVDESEDFYKMQCDKKNLIFLAAMNLREEGGGVPMAPKASGTNGCLTLSSASSIPKWKTFFCLPLLLAAKQNFVKGFDLHCVNKATLRLSKPMTLHADGEYCGEVKEVIYECLPGFLQLLN